MLISPKLSHFWSIVAFIFFYLIFNNNNNLTNFYRSPKKTKASIRYLIYLCKRGRKSPWMETSWRFINIWSSVGIGKDDEIGRCNAHFLYVLSYSFFNCLCFMSISQQFSLIFILLSCCIISDYDVHFSMYIKEDFF